MRIFFHQAIFFMFGNRKKSRGLNLENTVDVAAIRSPIPPISLRQRGIGVSGKNPVPPYIAFANSSAELVSSDVRLYFFPEDL
jgi:hypothetical protein